MDKQILYDYMDSCELVKETEREIMNLELKMKTAVRDTVSGSNPDFPYERKTFKVEGLHFSWADDSKIMRKRKLLEQRKKIAEEKKMIVEEWMNTVPSRVQRIVRYHFFDGLSWEETAKKMGRNVSGETIRKEFRKFAREK